MLRVLFLVLLLTTSTTFAQDERNPAPDETRNALVFEALSEEFGVIPNGQMKMYLDIFFAQLQNNPTAKGYIINYGAKRDVARRERVFRNHISFRKIDASQITFVRGKNEIELKTQFWILPKGSKPPTP